MNRLFKSIAAFATIAGAFCFCSDYALKSDLQALDERVFNLESLGVKSIAAIPTYSDGSMKVVSNGTSTFKFDVFPASTGETVAALPLDQFEVGVVYTATKASAGEKATLPISSVEYSGGELVVSVDASSLDKSFFSKDLAASAILSINDGTASINSGYFNLFGVKTSASGKLLLEVTEPSKFVSLPPAQILMDWPEGLNYDKNLPEIPTQSYAGSDELNMFTDYIKATFGVQIDNKWLVQVHYYDSEHITGVVKFQYVIRDDILTTKAISFSLMEGMVDMIIYSGLNKNVDENVLKNRINLFLEKYEQEKYQPKEGETVSRTETIYTYHYDYDLLLYSYIVYIHYSDNTGGDDYGTNCFIDKDGNAVFETPEGLMY